MTTYRDRWQRGAAKAAICGAIAFAAHWFVIAQQAAAASGASRAPVPFIGCESDGQIGPLKAPAGKAKAFNLAPSEAEKLAYYQAEHGPGVLAPRGWHCFSMYGSNGSSLYVTPAPMDTKAIFANDWHLAGPAIELSDSLGGTSGRFEVAGVIARVFPSHQAFVRRVVREGFASASNFPSGPYPDDELSYKSKSLVEYRTAANEEGLGTRSRLGKNDFAIKGVAILVESSSDVDLLLLAARLPQELTYLTSAITRQVETEGSRSAP